MSILQDILEKARGRAGRGGPTVADAVIAAIGVSGQTLSYGAVDDQEMSPELRGRRKFITYSNVMANTSIVATGVRHFLNILSGTTWRALPAKDMNGDEVPGSQEYADALNKIMGDMTIPWYRVVRRTSMYRYLGFSLQEWSAVRRPDGLIGIDRIAPRPQSTVEKWNVDPTGMVLGVWQRNPVTFEDIYLPRQRLVYAVDDTLNDSPEGIGILRHVVRAADRLRGYEDLEALGFETDLRGVPVGRAPLAELDVMAQSGATGAARVQRQLQPIMDFLQNRVLNRKTTITLDSETYPATGDSKLTPTGNRKWDVELLQGSGNAQVPVAAAIQRTNYEIARVLGIEHLLLGSDGTGSLALGKTKTQDFYQLLTATASELAEVYQRDFVGPHAILNGWPAEKVPRLVPDSVQFKDVSAMAAALRDMAAAGAVLAVDDPAIVEMRQLMGLSSPTSESIDRELEDASLIPSTGANGRAPVPGDPSGKLSIDTGAPARIPK